MSAMQVVRDLEALGVVLRFNAYKVDLTVPDKGAYIAAIQRLQVSMREGEYQTVVNMVRTRDAFGWNIPPDPCEGVECFRFHRIAELRAVCLSEGLCLYRAGQTIIPVAEPPYASNMGAVLAYAIAAIEEDQAELMKHAELFPELDQARAAQHIAQLARHHSRHGFSVRGWFGCQSPQCWPEVVRELVQTIYVMSIQDQGEA